MSYAGRFLRAHGQLCTILRTPPVESKISMKRSTRAIREYGAREAHWEALILADTNLKGGELFKIGDDIYLVQSTSLDYASKELSLFVVKTNCTVEHQRLVETVDSDYNILRSWSSVNTLYAYGEIITAELRARDPGLLQNTRYIFQIPQTAEVEIFDRIVFDGTNYRVDAVNDIGMAGVVRIQVSEDNR